MDHFGVNKQKLATDVAVAGVSSYMGSNKAPNASNLAEYATIDNAKKAY